MCSLHHMEFDGFTGIREVLDAFEQVRPSIEIASFNGLEPLRFSREESCSMKIAAQCLHARRVIGTICTERSLFCVWLIGWQVTYTWAQGKLPKGGPSSFTPANKDGLAIRNKDCDILLGK